MKRCMHPDCSEQALGTILRDRLDPPPLTDIYLCAKHLAIEVHRALAPSQHVCEARL